MGEIGEALRERRMAMKIDVHEAEEATKIRAKYLRALENEEYNLLPGPAYTKSFLRTYAEFLGLDGRALVSDYKSQHDRGEEEHAIFPSRRDPAQSRGPSRRWIAVVVAIVLIVLVLFLIGAIGGGSGAGS